MEPRELYLGRHVQPAPALVDPKRRVELLRRWIDDTDRAAAKLPPSSADWLWFVLAYQADALLVPTGLLHVELERSIALSRDDPADETAARRDAFRAMAKRSDLEDDLEYTAKREPGEALYPNVLQQGNDSSEARGAEAIAIACYTPADLLARYVMGPGLAELLSLPFRIVAADAFPSPKARLAPSAGGKLDASAVRASLDQAIERATTEFPSLRMRADHVDVATAARFVTTFNEQLQGQVLDPKGKPAAKKAAKGKATAKRAVAPPEPDWRAMEDAIVERGRRAANAFAAEHGPAAALVLDTDPPASYVLFSFETAAGLVASVTGFCREEAARRTKALAAKDAWKEARAHARLGDAINPGDFTEMEFDRVDFGDAMEKFDGSDGCPEAPYDGEGYVRARFRIALARAVDRMVADGALDALLGDGPLLVGYTFHEEPTVVLHVLARGRAKPPKPHAKRSRT